MNVSIADAPITQPTTTLIDNSNGQMPNTLAYLKQHYNATIVNECQPDERLSERGLYRHTWPERSADAQTVHRRAVATRAGR